MISGRELLGRIEAALQQGQQQLAEVDRAIAELKQQLLQAEQQRAGALRNLARIRVGRLASGDLVDRIDHSEGQVVELLQRRQSQGDELERRLGDVRRRADALQARRSAAVDALEQAADAVDQAEAVTQARLDRDPDYRARRERAEQAQRVAENSDDKAGRSAQELADKGAAYRDDPLFSYLWERRYGTADYRANHLIRWLDGKVAALIAYRDARLNYQRLQALPLRLREYADAKAAAAQQQFDLLQALDRQAREQDGIVALAAAREQARQALEGIDGEIDAAADEQGALLDRQAAFAAGDDPGFRQAIDYLASEYGRDDLTELRREALATPLPDDDKEVDRLFDSERRQQQLQASANEMQLSEGARRQRLREIERLRRDFRQRGFDQPGSGFADRDRVLMMVESFVGGTLDRDGLWRVLSDQRRYQARRSDPAFGSGGLGRGTVWGGSAGDARVLGELLGGMVRGARRRGGLGGGIGGLGGLGGGRGSAGRGGSGGGFRTGGGF